MTILINKKKLIKDKTKFNKVIAIIAIALFLVSINSFIYSDWRNVDGVPFTQTWLVYIVELENTSTFDINLSNVSLIFSGVGIWFFIGTFIVTSIRPFFEKNKLIVWLIKYCFTPLFLVSLIFYGPECVLLLNGNVTNNLLNPSNYLFALTFGLVFFNVLNTFLDTFNDKEFILDSDKNLFKTLLSALGVLLASIPPYLIQYYFGNLWKRGDLAPLGFSVLHRIFIYLAILVPITLYFIFRYKNKETIKIMLIIYSSGALINFMFKTDYQMFLFNGKEDLPLHLCNLSLYLILICLVFKSKRLFYFVYLFSVFGAVMALLLPNYSRLYPPLDSYNIHYMVNHIAVVAIPILMVAFNIYPRPKFKDYKWALVWFSIYFVVVFINNTLFDTSYLFLNEPTLKDYAAILFGDWINDIYNFKVEFTLFNNEYFIRPLFVIGFGLFFILFSLLVWFIYNLFYIVGDRHELIHNLDLKTRLEDKKYKEKLKELKGDLKMGNEYLLEIENLFKKYLGTNDYAVKNLSLRLKGGEIFGLVGPNGAGKTTTLKCIVGILSPTKGNIKVDGFDVEHDSINAKSLIGYVSDSYALYERLTGRQYINYVADIYGISKQLREMLLNKYVTLFHLENNIDQQINSYSYGMKQKLTIISTLIHKPKVWILDEPLTGLDPESIYDVKQVMKEYAEKGNLVVFSSHLIDVVENLCTSVAVINNGNLNEVKLMKDIKRNYPNLETYFMMETKKK